MLTNWYLRVGWSYIQKNMWPWDGWWQSQEVKRQQDFCSKSFPDLWISWVNGFTDFGFAGFSTATPRNESAVQTPPCAAPAAQRLIAIGDLHGDMRKTLRAFRLANLIDENGRWSGGDTVCVQVQDQMQMQMQMLLEHAFSPLADYYAGWRYTRSWGARIADLLLLREAPTRSGACRWQVSLLHFAHAILRPQEFPCTLPVDYLF